MKQRRKRRNYYNWAKEIAKGNTNKFYNSTDWDILREKVLIRDKYTCQFFCGKWSDNTHKPKYLKIVKADMVHHIIPIKERPNLALDIDNCISLSFEAHEIIEERIDFNLLRIMRKKKVLTEEKW